MFGSGMNLITTVIGFGMSIAFIVFICTRLICGRVRAGESQLEMVAEFRSEPDHTGNGLEHGIVSAFPTMKFTNDVFQSKEDAQCSICLGDYEEKEVLRLMPPCGHNFHLLCIDIWLQKHSTCPVCRISLCDSFETKHGISPIFPSLMPSSNSPNDRSNDQWLLPTPDQTSSSSNNNELHDSATQNMETGVPIGELRPAD